MPSSSLRAYGADPISIHSPLPRQSDRRRRPNGDPTDWPVGLLPHAAIAADLAADGVTFQRGTGYAVHGEPVEATAVALLVADLLEDVARGLAPWFDASEDLREHLEDDVAATRVTARQIRISAPARKNLLGLVRLHLPIPARPSSDAAAAGAFLALYDGSGIIARSTLARDYVAHGTPGDMTKADLLALAADRFGAPRKSNGAFVFHAAPDDSAPSAREQASGLDTHLAALVALHGLDAVRSALDALPAA